MTSIFVAIWYQITYNICRALISKLDVCICFVRREQAIGADPQVERSQHDLVGSLPIFNHIMLIRKLLHHFVENSIVVMYIYKRRSQHSLARYSPFQRYSQVCSKFGPYCLLLFEGSLERSKQFKLLNRPHCITARLTVDILITAPRTELRYNLTERCVTAVPTF